MFEISGEISTSNISWIRSVTVFTECWTFSVLQLRLLPVSEDTGNILTKLFYIIKLLKLLIDKDKLFKLNYFNCLSCSALLDPKINILSTTHKYPSRSDLIYIRLHIEKLQVLRMSHLAMVGTDTCQWCRCCTHFWALSSLYLEE